jgi:hypothetical protein
LFFDVGGFPSVDVEVVLEVEQAAPGLLERLAQGKVDGVEELGRPGHGDDDVAGLDNPLCDLVRGPLLSTHLLSTHLPYSASSAGTGRTNRS